MSLPYNEDAEAHVLGAVLLNPNTLDKVLAILRPEHFYLPKHQLIAKALVDLQVRDLPVDPLTVADRLASDGTLDQAGGKAHLAELVASVTYTTNVERHAHLVVEEWKKREIITMVLETKALVENAVDADDTVGFLEHNLENLRGRIDTGNDRIRSMYDLVDEIDQRIKNPPPPGLECPAPFSFLPALVGGRLYVLGGYTADGKTVCAVQYLRSAAGTKRRVGIVTNEMTDVQLAERTLVQAGAPYAGILGNKIAAPYKADYEKAVERTCKMRVDVLNDSAADAEMIGRFQRAGNYEMLIVDHLHRMDWSERRDLERQVVGITNIALRFRIPILLIVQLSRSAGGANPFPHPSLRSLRETAVIEQEASRVDFVYRHRDDKHLPTADGEYIIAKNRFGDTGTWPLTFDTKTVTFKEVP